MNSFAFIIMLGIFAALAYWYILNIEGGSDGERGFMGLKPDMDVPLDALGRKLAGHRKAGDRALIQKVQKKARDAQKAPVKSAYEHTKHTPAAEKVRERAREKAMEDELEEMEANRRRYDSPRSDTVRRRTELADAPRARSPFPRDRGLDEPLPGDLEDRIRQARLGLKPEEDPYLDENAPRSEKPKAYRIREKKKRGRRES